MLLCCGVWLCIRHSLITAFWNDDDLLNLIWWMLICTYFRLLAWHHPTMCDRCYPWQKCTYEQPPFWHDAKYISPASSPEEGEKLDIIAERAENLPQYHLFSSQVFNSWNINVCYRLCCERRQWRGLGREVKVEAHFFTPNPLAIWRRPTSLQEISLGLYNKHTGHRPACNHNLPSRSIRHVWLI